MGIFLDVADRACFQAGEHRVLVAQHRDHQRLASRLQGLEAVDQFEPMSVRQGQIGQQQVCGMGLQPCQSVAKAVERGLQFEPGMLTDAGFEVLS